MELDRLLDLLAARHSFRARLRSNEPMQIWSDSGWVSANITVSGEELHRLLAVAATPEVRAFVQQPNTRYEFDFPHISGIYRIHVEDANGRLTVFVLRLEQFTPPQGATQVEPSQEANLPATPHSSELPATTPLLESEHNSSTARTVVVDPSEVLEAEPDSSWSHTDDELHWFYGHEGQSVGPHTFEQMGAFIASGDLPPETMVFDSRVGDWQEAGQSELKRFYEIQNQRNGSHTGDEHEGDAFQNGGSSKKRVGLGLLVAGLVVVVSLGGWSGLNQVRETNSTYDYSTEFADKIVQESSVQGGGALHNVRLQRSFTLPSHYFGTAQFSDGYLADVQFDVESRDFFERPAQTDYHATPHDFAIELEAPVMESMNSYLTSLNTSYRVDSVSLRRGIGNEYSGTLHFNEDITRSVTVEIQEFDAQGNISKWDYKPVTN